MKILSRTSIKNNVNLKFCGIFYNISKLVVKLFTKRYRFEVETPKTQANFYVCRHKNLRGVIRVMKSSNFDMHPFILHVFSTQKSAFSHFCNYTFSKRYKLPKILRYPLSFICSFFMASLFKSAKGIKTFRNSAKAIITVKTTTEYLLLGESVIVFPDVDYKSTLSTVGEIYEGFLTVEKIYYKKTGKHVNFIPLAVDEKTRKITEGEPINFSGETTFSNEKPKVVEKLKKCI